MLELVLLPCYTSTGQSLNTEENDAIRVGDMDLCTFHSEKPASYFCPLRFKDLHSCLWIGYWFHRRKMNKIGVGGYIQATLCRAAKNINTSDTSPYIWGCKRLSAGTVAQVDTWTWVDISRTKSAGHRWAIGGLKIFQTVCTYCSMLSQVCINPSCLCMKVNVWRFMAVQPAGLRKLQHQNMIDSIGFSVIMLLRSVQGETLVVVAWACITVIVLHMLACQQPVDT